MTTHNDRTVWKFPLNLIGEPVIPMPRGAQILTVQMQDGQPQLWALVDPAQPVERRRLFIVGTGQPMPTDAATYLATWQSGPFVFHLFEESR
ncbi:DUF7352 domain-containing protein [Amycolatopsis thermoflava]|uniref:DUF7352 domain-containing protein n=1 Tax=Amycolatopsis thermoflava TaxID=84480 RepID=UPI0003FAE1EE|nr:hypothetical protein [Amycolatopsis thermoflava]